MFEVLLYLVELLILVCIVNVMLIIVLQSALWEHLRIY